MLGADLAEVVVDLEAEGFSDGGPRPMVFATDFDLLRRPGHVYTGVWQ